MLNRLVGLDIATAAQIRGPVVGGIPHYLRGQDSGRSSRYELDAKRLQAARKAESQRCLDGFFELFTRSEAILELPDVTAYKSRFWAMITQRVSRPIAIASEGNYTQSVRLSIGGLRDGFFFPNAMDGLPLLVGFDTEITDTNGESVKTVSPPRCELQLGSLSGVFQSSYPGEITSSMFRIGEVIAATEIALNLAPAQTAPSSVTDI